MSNEKNTTDQEAYTCPRCGHKGTDALGDDLFSGYVGHIRCDKCSASFAVTATLTQTFTTWID